MVLGILYALCAYVMWGIFPLYFHSLQSVGAVEIITHRIVWSCVFSLILLIAMGKWGNLKPTLKDARTLLIFALAGFLVVINWGSYVYAIVTDRTIEASLGYFVTPLLAVSIGAFIFKEKLFPVQKIAVAIATLALCWLTVMSGTFPTLGVAIAVSWTFYGYVRKVTKLESLEGFVLQSLILTPVALAVMLYFYQKGTFVFSTSPIEFQAWLMLTGPVTTIPLLLFVAGVRRVPFSLIGMLQYVNPTLIFLVGLFAFNEPFNRVQFIGYLMIWIAAFLFAADTYVRSQKATSSAKRAKKN